MDRTKNVGINQQPLLSVKEVAHKMNVSSRTVMRWLDAGWLKSIRIGGIIRIPPEDLQRLIEDGVSSTQLS